MDPQELAVDDLERLRAQMRTAVAATVRVVDPVERERVARTLGDLAADLSRASRRVRSAAVREVRGDLSVRAAAARLGLSRSQVDALGRR